VILHQFDNARAFLPALEWAGNEVIDNILLHAESRVPGTVSAQYFPKMHRLDIGICDMGRGIKASLQEAMFLWSHGDAVTKALGRGVTRNPTVGQGNGWPAPSTSHAPTAGIHFLPSSCTSKADALIPRPCNRCRCPSGASSGSTGRLTVAWHPDSLHAGKIVGRSPRASPLGAGRKGTGVVELSLDWIRGYHRSQTLACVAVELPLTRAAGHQFSRTGRNGRFRSGVGITRAPTRRGAPL